MDYLSTLDVDKAVPDTETLSTAETRSPGEGHPGWQTVRPYLVLHFGSLVLHTGAGKVQVYEQLDSCCRLSLTGGWLQGGTSHASIRDMIRYIHMTSDRSSIVTDDNAQSRRSSRRHGLTG
jgi:hypothetical protein